MTHLTLPPLPELLHAVREITERAGDLAVGLMAQAIGEVKADSTLVTEVDRQVEQFLRRELSALAPDIGFLGEEYGHTGDTENLWIVDPIDGTNNLVYRVPMWGVSVGLALGGQPALGVFHLPLVHETFTAARGHGAFLNGAPLIPRDAPTTHRQELIGITTDVARDWDLTGVYGFFRLFGSIAAEVAYVAKGSLNACVSLGDKVVDLGAVIPITLEAGCEWRYLSGDAFDFAEWLAHGPRPEPLLVGPTWAVEELRATLRKR